MNVFPSSARMKIMTNHHSGLSRYQCRVLLAALLFFLLECIVIEVIVKDVECKTISIALAICVILADLGKL